MIDGNPYHFSAYAAIQHMLNQCLNNTDISALVQHMYAETIFTDFEHWFSIC